MASCTFPDSIPDDDYYIGVIVTRPDDIDLENNQEVDSDSPVWVGSSADLSVQSVQVAPGVYEPDEIYVKVFTEGVSGAYPQTKSKICILTDTVFNETYACVSAAHPHPGDASVVINLTAPDHGEFIVFDAIVEGFVKAKTFLDVELKEIRVFWPSEDGGSYFDPCDVGIYIEQHDRRDRDVIMHEYAHYVAQTYGVGLGPEGGSSVHCWDRDLRNEPVWRTSEHAMNLAYREAWASVFSIATQSGDTLWPNAGDSKYSDVDEEGSWTLTVDLDNIGGSEFSPGQYFENMNAGALWDIFDGNDGVHVDETLSDPSLSMIWTISRYYKPENIIDFWNSWFRDYDYEHDMKYIFESHQMPFV
ncbi:MAG: hypothetical protein K9N55_03305 [Phycisphaerae bacterium]|nr:hypothetical protein [Phycisphaerae bacterium]